MENYIYYDPKKVTSPKQYIENIQPFFDGGADSFSIAKISWDGEKHFAMRWNVAANEYNDEDKKTGKRECVGMPSSHGYPVWFLLPKEFTKESIENIVKTNQGINKIPIEYVNEILS